MMGDFDYGIWTFLFMWIVIVLGDVAFVRAWGGDWDDARVGAACGLLASPAFLLVGFAGSVLLPALEGPIWLMTFACLSVADSLLLGWQCDIRLPFLLGPVMNAFCAVLWSVASSWYGITAVPALFVIMAMACDRPLLPLLASAPTLWFFYAADVPEWLGWAYDTAFFLLGWLFVAIAFGLTIAHEVRRRKGRGHPDD